MRIYTLTLNPAYDIHAEAASFAAGQETLATVTSREAGGKGVNISRALANGGVPNTAVVVLGQDNAGDFRQGIEKAGIHAVYLEKPGRIRENLTLHCAGQPETRISFAGFSVEDSILEEVLNVMTVDSETVVTFTGRVPAGMSPEKVKAFLQELKNRGAKLVLDSKSLTAQDILDLKPWLIKPNQEEVAVYAGCPVETMEEAAQKGKLFADAQVENVVISMGGQGAVLLHRGKAYTAVPPKIQPVSTVGAGDSMIAGFLAATAMGEAPAQCLKRAVAYGTAACLTQGTEPPEQANIDAIYQEVIQ